MKVIVDGLLTNYLRAGEGPTILILHGWGDQVQHWHKFITMLSEKYDVVAPDLPGFGGTQQPPAAWDLTEYAEFVNHFLAKVAVQPSAIIGHSNGGALAIHGIATGQLNTQKLVLLASAGIRHQDHGRTVVFHAIAKLGKLATLPLPRSLRQRLRGLLYGAAGSDLLVAEHLTETFKRVVAQDVLADAAQLKLPVLLLYGDHDQETPVRYGELFHSQISDSRLVKLTGAGHFLYVERDLEVVQAIREFV